jgi:hypothetical protein
MIARVVLMLTIGALLASLLGALRLPPPSAAQDLVPTPVGRLGGREPLPTAEGMPGAPLPSPTSAPAGHLLLGAWLLTFAEADRPAAELAIREDGLVEVIDGEGNRGAGVWMASGQRLGVLAVAIQTVDAAERSPRITLLQGTIAVGTRDDAATLDYTIVTVDASGAPAEPAGPFLATAQRVSEG